MRKDRVNFTLSKEGQNALDIAARHLGLSKSAWIEMTARVAEKLIKETEKGRAS